MSSCPIRLWDFGSAAVHHKRYSDWLEPDHCLAGVVGMRGTIPPEFGLMKKYAKMIAQLIKDAGMADMPVGVDYAAASIDAMRVGVTTGSTRTSLERGHAVSHATWSIRYVIPPGHRRRQRGRNG